MAQEWAKEEEGRDADDYRPDMPPVEGAAYLIGDLFTPGEAGKSVEGAMGAGPLTHGAIRDWMENTGVRRLPWECRFLVRLSHEYLAEAHRAKKRDAKAPWQSADAAKPEVSETQLAIRALANL